MFVHPFRESFGEAVGQRLGHDRVVVVIRLFEARDNFRSAHARCHRKRSEIIGEASLFGSNKVRERILGVAVRLLHLLAQSVKGAQEGVAGTVRVNLDVVSHAIRRKKTGDAARRKLPLTDNLMQQLLRIIEKLFPAQGPTVLSSKMRG